MRGDVDLAAYGPCRWAVLEQMRVDPAYTRRGYGRRSRSAPGFNRSTTVVDQADPVTRAFWTAVDWPSQLGTPTYRTDMRHAAGLSSD